MNFSQLGGTLSMTQPFEHSLMAPPELDAASVLNQMCHSRDIYTTPSTFSPPTSPFQPPRNPDSGKKPNRREKTLKTSLFQKVMGGKKK